MGACFFSCKKEPEQPSSRSLACSLGSSGVGSWTYLSQPDEAEEWETFEVNRPVSLIGHVAVGLPGKLVIQGGQKAASARERSRSFIHVNSTTRLPLPALLRDILELGECNCGKLFSADLRN